MVKIANIGMGIAGCFFPGIPTIPDEVLAKGDDILSGLDHKSSAEDFACIQGALDSKATGGGADDFQKQVRQSWPCSNSKEGRWLPNMWFCSCLNLQD